MGGCYKTQSDMRNELQCDHDDMMRGPVCENENHTKHGNTFSHLYMTFEIPGDASLAIDPWISSVEPQVPLNQGSRTPTQVSEFCFCIIPLQ